MISLLWLGPVDQYRQMMLEGDKKSPLDLLLKQRRSPLKTAQTSDLGLIE